MKQTATQGPHCRSSDSPERELAHFLGRRLERPAAGSGVATSEDRQVPEVGRIFPALVAPPSERPQAGEALLGTDFRSQFSVQTGSIELRVQAPLLAET